MSVATERALRVLADGRWHPLTALVDEIAPLFPPGPAYRRTEQARRRLQRSRGMPESARQRGDRGTAVIAGQRIAARSVVRGLRMRGRVEERTVRATIEVRVIPTRKVR